MKRRLLTVVVCFLALHCSAQRIITISQTTRIGLYGGVGLATSNNYNVGTSYGLDFDKYLGGRAQIGALLFLQGYSLYYDNEVNGMKHGHGETGVTLRHASNYVFFAPQLRYLLWSKLNFMSWVGVNVGVGFGMSGYDSLHKWDRSYGNTSVGYYDSVIDASPNINKMITRIGVSFNQDTYLRKGNWWFTFKEDFGLIYNGLTKSGDPSNNNPSRTPYSPRKLNPGYISFQIGIAYIAPKNKR